jgi:hypothetical protein
MPKDPRPHAEHGGEVLHILEQLDLHGHRALATRVRAVLLDRRVHLLL